MKMSWKIVGLVGGALLVNAPQASADLKSVFTAVCKADDDTIRAVSSLTTQPDKTPPVVCSSVPPPGDCRTLMLCMDRNGWHVIHDTRYGGAWFEFSSVAPVTGEARYKLIFQKD